MPEKIRGFIILSFSAVLCYCFTAEIPAFAASDSSSGTVSKGTAAAVIIGIFVAVSIVSAIITFKLRMKNSGGKNKDDSKEE